MTPITHIPRLVALLLALNWLPAIATAHDEKTAQAQHAEHEEHKEHGEHEEGEEHEEHEEGALNLNAEQLRTAGIETGTVSRADIPETLPLYGTVTLNGDTTQHLGARFAGVIRAVNKQQGDAVKKGEVLASIESNDSLRTYPVTADMDGTVIERHATVGEQTDDTPLFTVSNLDTVWVDAALFPRDVAAVRIGQHATVTHPALAAPATGDIVAISHTSASNQALTARLRLNNTDRRWTPGLFVNVHVLLGSTPVAMAVRSDAIQTHEGQSVVFVKTPRGFEPRPIVTGRSNGTLTEVTHGVNPGDTYVTQNSFILKADLGKGGAEHEH